MIEEKSMAAIAAWFLRFLDLLDLFSSRIDFGTINLRGTVLGVGAEMKIWLPKKLEESRGLVNGDAIEMLELLDYCDSSKFIGIEGSEKGIFCKRKMLEFGVLGNVS